jgi:fermentation-respiration switch protein FrsA (DUF1100 family)
MLTIPCRTLRQDPAGYTMGTEAGTAAMVLSDPFGQPTTAFTPVSFETSALFIDSGPHRLACVYVQNPAARYTILLSHGNAEDLGLLAPFIETLANRLGVSVFAYDPPGYGQSTGPPREQGLYDGVEAAWCCLRQKFGIAAKRIVLYGTSIGSAPSVYLAAKFGKRFGEGSPNTPAGMILHAPLASGIRVLRLKTSVTWCCDPFANVSRIEAVTVPTLIVHGTNDEIVSVEHSYKLQSMCHAAVAPLFVQAGGHNDLDTFPAFYPRLTRFLAEVDTDLGLKPEGPV